MRQVVIYPGEDGQWVVEVPSLPGCVSQGATREEALRNIREAIDLWIETMRQKGSPIPTENYDVQVCIVA